MMKVSDIRSRVNPSNFYPAFNRLRIDLYGDRHVRRSLETFRREASGVQKIQTRGQYTDMAIEGMDKIANVFAELADFETGREFSVEAQRIFCSFYDRPSIDTRGATGVVCINRYNVDGGFVEAMDIRPGIAYVDPRFPLRISPLHIGDSGYDVVGYMDCFLLHIHEF